MERKHQRRQPNVVCLLIELSSPVDLVSQLFTDTYEEIPEKRSCRRESAEVHLLGLGTVTLRKAKTANISQ